MLRGIHANIDSRRSQNMCKIDAYEVSAAESDEWHDMHVHAMPLCSHVLKHEYHDK